MQAGVTRAIIICALGYFIDIFDIQLFAVLRVSSLTELGVPHDQLATVGGTILSVQMFGMILGAFLWGWLGDRFGRLKALYGSILVYSLGTLACSLVHDPVTYGICRFVAGYGLAGETGAAITLIAELMSRENRGWGATIVGGFGSLGPAAAVLVSWFLPWRETYIAAGILGLILLVLRMKLLEPAMFQKITTTTNLRGSLKLFAQRKPAFIFLCMVIIGMPNMYGINLLNFYSLELSHQVLRAGEIFDQKTSLLIFYIGLGCGNALWPALSQIWQSRRKAMIASVLFSASIATLYLAVGPIIKFPVTVVYLINFSLGLAGGLALSITMAAEQFGTNIRATSSILVSNFMRGGIIPIVMIFQWLQTTTTVSNAAALVGAFLYITALMALCQLHETHGVDLDYVESLKEKD